jgi:Ribosome-associated heat shock protein implicated in the recycling of the 50S subunit (S4 paralog)
MRLDKFLKVSRLIKRRTVAQSACSGSNVDVNGKVAKPGQQIKEGDVLTIHFGEKPLTVRVLRISESVRKDEAGAMYEVI